MEALADQPAKRTDALTGLLVAMAYLVLGALGLLLAIPPGFASPVFPAAGFALACALLYGRSALPWIWLGSFALNVGQMLLSGTLGWGFALTAAAVGLGAMLQAGVGAFLVARRGDWRSLASERAVLHFLLRGGVLACLVSSVLSVSVLHLAGALQGEAWLFSWWNWYTGDLIGVVIFAPLAMLALSGDNSLWRERRWRVGMPILLALVLALVAFAAAMRWDREQAQDQLEQDGEKLARLVRTRLVASREILSSLRRFVEASPDFDYQKFETFTRATLADNPDLSALSFNDLVNGPDLLAYEQRVGRQSPVDRYRVTELNERGELVPVRPRDAHVVVRYILPLKGNLPAVGYDINSEPIRRAAIERARTRSGMAVTAPIRLVQDDGVRMGVLALQPVHLPQPGVQEGPGKLAGFAVAVVKVDELVGIATRGQVPPGLTLSVTDPAAASGADRFDLPGATPPAAAAPAAMRWSTNLAFGDRPWRLEVSAQPAYFANQRQWMAWAVGVVGLLFAGLLQVYLLGVSGRAATIRRQNEALLASQSDLLLADAVFRNAGEAVAVVDRSGCIVSVNPAFTRITGYTADEARHQTLRSLAGSDLPAPEEEAMWQALADDSQWRGERKLQRKRGETYFAMWTITAIQGEALAAPLYVSTFADITEQKKALEQIEFLAYHDSLTSLPNRVMGRERALRAIAHARRHERKVAILFLDLDHFKLVNDSYGHSVGDELLRAVAVRLRAQLRAGDTLCRLSGDEFMVILEDINDSSQVVSVCEKILNNVANPFDLRGHHVQVYVTVGVSIFPTDGDDPETLLRHADTALFQAKQSGRNTYRLFDASMNADVVRFVRIRDELQLALKNQEFELYYQPQVNLADGSCRSVEALLRWNSPSRGLVMPGEFIAIAEESGLISPIGEWVLRQACKQLAQWQAAGVKLDTVAVNLSAVQLRRPGIERVLRQALQTTGLKPECLELELTESVLIHDRNNTLDKLEEILGHGVSLSIDDFGTGYSSMAYLKRLRVHRLKIDRSFAADVATDAEDAAIVTAIVTLARSLGLRTVAEGVETAESAAVLREMGCEQAQGYLYARPMPADKLVAWCEERQAQG